MGGGGERLQMNDSNFAINFHKLIIICFLIQPLVRGGYSNVQFELDQSITIKLHISWSSLLSAFCGFRSCLVDMKTCKILQFLQTTEKGKYISTKTIYLNHAVQ